MKEEYRKLKEYPMYRIYNTGKIFSEWTGKFIKQFDDNSGYLQVTVFLDKRERRTIKTHILVAKAFLPNPNNLPEVNHKDCNKKHNSVDNLEWVSKEENMRHAVKYSYRNRETLSPLSRNMVKMIPILLEYGCSIKLIAKLYKVGHITIRNIIARRTWKLLDLDFKKSYRFNRGTVILPDYIYDKLLTFNIDNTVLNERVKRLSSV